jgi:hypothetical protein
MRRLLAGLQHDCTYCLLLDMPLLQHVPSYGIITQVNNIGVAEKRAIIKTIINSNIYLQNYKK